MKYHLAADIRSALTKPSHHLEGMFRHRDGTTLTADEIRDECIRALREGFDVIPPCENVDERGLCKGHPE